MNRKIRIEKKKEVVNMYLFFKSFEKIYFFFFHIGLLKKSFIKESTNVNTSLLMRMHLRFQTRKAFNCLMTMCEIF